MIEIIRGNCPQNNIQLRIKYPVGGATPSSDSYFVWFEEQVGVTNSYISPKCNFPNGYVKKLRFDYPLALPPLFAFEIPIVGYLDTFGADSLANYLQRASTGLLSYGRAISYGATYLEVFISPSDPLYSLLTCTTGSVASNVYLAPYPAGIVTYNGQAGCCGNIPTNQLITGWRPIASGLGLDTVSIAYPRKARYLVEVTDKSGTTDTETLEYEELSLVCMLTTFQPLCLGDTGSIEVTIPSWLSGDLTFRWTYNGAFFSNAMNISNLSPGTYCLIVTDANSCIIRCCSTIISPTPITLDIDITQPLCVACGKPDQFGRLFVQVSGGNEDCSICDNSIINNKSKGAYEYQLLPTVAKWTQVDRDNSIFIDNLKPGIYKLKVRDCNCCFVQQDITITKPTIIVNV